MQPPWLKPDRYPLTERPVVDSICQDAQTRTTDLADAKCLRAQLFDNADLKRKRIRSLTQRDVFRSNSQNDILVHVLMLRRKRDLQRAALEDTVRCMTLHEIHLR